MSAPRLPQKFVKVGPKPNVKVKKNSSCRFCGVNFSSEGEPASFENLVSPSGIVESAELILAHCCRSIWLRLTRNENLSERVCRPCARKIRNTAQLYSFVEKAVATLSSRKIYIKRLWKIEAKDSFPPLLRQKEAM